MTLRRYPMDSFLARGLVLVLPITVSCGGGGGAGATSPTNTPAPVASVSVASPASVVLVGATLAMTATLRDAAGNTLSGRTVVWTSSDNSKAGVSSTGVATGIAAGSATITATSEGKSGSLAITVNVPPASGIFSGLRDPVDFAAHCPADDPAFAQIRGDFVLLSDGVPSTATVVCNNPYSTMSPMSEELMEWQALRLVYAISPGTAGKLPWTALPLYDWLKAQISGIDIKTQPGNSACCETINGKRYFITSRKDVTSLGAYRDWLGLSNWLGLILHESRHVLGPGHVNGCPAFPLPSDPAGCDATYDLQNLGSYGVQYWFFSSLANGSLNVGIGCLPSSTAQQYATSAASTANVYPGRFVTNAPPAVTATVPYGGPCSPP
jgi:hypothetical protein